MQPNRSSGDSPLHQPVAGKIKFESAGQSIPIEFTDQQLSPHAGTATFWSFLHQSGWRELVAQCLPHPTPTSNHALSPLTKVLSFVQGLLCGAKKLTHVAFFLDLWHRLPSHLRLRVVRADSGFYVAALLHLWEKLRVKFIVVARLTQPVQSLLRHETRWLPTGIDGTEVAELDHREADVPPARASSPSATGSKTKRAAPAANC